MASKLQNCRNLIEIIIAERDISLRGSLRSMLIDEGYCTIKHPVTFQSVVDELNTSLPDLAIIDIGIDDNEILISTIRELRHLGLGQNPFVPIIITAWDSTAAIVREIVNAGIDDFIMKPFSPKQLADRIQLLINARKPFVVTSDYIGPDRRNDKERASTIKPIVVPNSLRDKNIFTFWDEQNFLQSIQQTKELINSEKARRTAAYASFLIKLIVEDLEQSRDLANILLNIGRLKTAVSELTRRLTTDMHEILVQMIETLTRLSASITEDPTKISSKDIRLMPLLGMAIMKMTYPERDEIALAQDITSAVAGYRSRRNE